MIPASYFPSERQYAVKVTAADAYVKYTENFNVSVEFAVDFSLTVTPSEPVYNDRSYNSITDHYFYLKNFLTFFNLKQQLVKELLYLRCRCFS